MEKEGKDEGKKVHYFQNLREDLQAGKRAGSRQSAARSPALALTA